jgi:hypothetical protein
LPNNNSSGSFPQLIFSNKHGSSQIFGVTHVLFNELINKGVGRPYANPDFAKSEAAFSKTMFERRRRRSEFGFPRQWWGGDFKQNRWICIQP